MLQLQFARPCTVVRVPSARTPIQVLSAGRHTSSKWVWIFWFTVLATGARPEVCKKNQMPLAWWPSNKPCCVPTEFPYVMTDCERI